MQEGEQGGVKPGCVCLLQSGILTSTGKGQSGGWGANRQLRLPYPMFFCLFVFVTWMPLSISLPPSLPLPIPTFLGRRATEDQLARVSLFAISGMVCPSLPGSPSPCSSESPRLA